MPDSIFPSDLWQHMLLGGAATPAPRTILQPYLDGTWDNPPAAPATDSGWATPDLTPWQSPFPPDVTNGRMLMIPPPGQDSFGNPLPSAGLPDPGAVTVLSNAIGQAGQSAGLAPGAASAPDPRTVHSLGGGKVTGAGWQNPDDHSAGLGWRVYVQDPNGYRTGYGHMDPSSTPSVGTIVNAGDPLGVYADPTNGSSTGPHVHVIKYGPDQKPIDPGTASPLTNGKITTTFGKIDKSHPTPQNGVDWAAPR